MVDNTIQRERFSAYEELFQIYTNTTDVNVHASRTGDVVERSRHTVYNPTTGKREQRYRWRVGLKVGDGHHVLLHEVGHVLFGSLDGAEKYLQKVGNPKVMHIWNAAEDVRIERMTEEHFGKPLRPLHRQQLIDEDNGEPWVGLGNMVGALLFDVPVETVGTDAEKRALEHFKDDLIASTFSETPMETAKVAIRIAAYMDWLESVAAPPKPETPDTETEDGDDGGSGDGDAGGGSSEPPEPETSPEPQKTERKETPSSFDTVNISNSPGTTVDEEADDGDDFDGDVMNIVLDAGGKESYTESPELQELLTKTERSIDRTVKNDVKRKIKDAEKAGPAVARTRHEITYAPDKEPVKNLTLGIAEDHVTWMMAVDTETIMVSEQAQFALENAEGRTARRSRHTGRPTRKAWRLEYGETRVFAKPPKTRGKVVCLVDLSGSMGCWCEACNSKEDRPSSGWLAWQTVAVLSTRFPDMEVFGFIGSPWKNYIVPVPTKQQPMCRNRMWKHSELMQGNPDCAALMWLEEYLGLSSSNASAIVISDGMPNGPSPVRCNEISHTREVAHRLNDAGVSYASVLVRTSNSDLYPNEITAYVNDPSDIRDLQGVLDWMNQK